MPAVLLNSSWSGPGMRMALLAHWAPWLPISEIMNFVISRSWWGCIETCLVAKSCPTLRPHGL